MKFSGNAQGNSKKHYESNSWPQITLWISPCRSGSSAIMKAVGFGGTYAVYQPLKAEKRRKMAGNNTSYQFPKEVKSIYIKETLGPYKKQELFNPLQELLDLGVPASKIQVIIAKRNPLETATSWVREFTHNETPEVLIKNLIDVYKNIDVIKIQAEKLHIPVTSFAYDVLGKFAPELVIKNFLNRLQLPFSPRVFQDWATLPKMGEQGSNVEYSEEPETYRSTPEHPIHEKTENSHGLTYYSKNNTEIVDTLGQRNIDKIIASGITTKYQEIIVDCIRDLGLEKK